MTTRTHICAICEEITTHTFTREPETMDIRGESITVDVGYWTCGACGEQSIDLKSEYDHLAEAYKLYEERTGLKIPPHIVREGP